MKELMKSNIYDIESCIVIVGSCLKNMQPVGYNKLKTICNNIYEVCLEETHINMAITKVGSMLRTNKIEKVIFASVDKSPHCVQLHYIQDELRKMMDIKDIDIENYVVVGDELVKVNAKVISLSKNLKGLSELENKII